MLNLLGNQGRLCDSWSRREILQAGAMSLFGISLPQFLRLNEAQASPAAKSSAFGKAKSVIFLFLQGGPSHIDLWDPKPDASSEIRSRFKNIPTKAPGIELTELLPKLSQQMHMATLIRSMSYTPVGLTNHTAAMYQMMTGFTPDKVSPAGQLEPPAPNDFPTAAAHVAKLRPPDVPMLPAVMLPRPMQESGVINKGGTAGFLGKAYEPYYIFPPGNDLQQDKMDHVNLDDLSLRIEISSNRLDKRRSLLRQLNDGMPEIDKAVSKMALRKYYTQAIDILHSGRARKALELKQESDKMRDRYGRSTFGQSCLLARRLIEAGTRFVQVNWPSVANDDPKNASFDTHYDQFLSLKDKHCPKLDSALSALLEDLSNRGMLAETLVVAVGEFGRSPRYGVGTSGNFNTPDGRDHWPYCYTGLVAGAGIRPGAVYGKSDATGSAPKEQPVHPAQLLATVYYSLGIDPGMMINNHLNQPRELVQAEPLLGLFG